MPLPAISAAAAIAARLDANRVVMMFRFSVKSMVRATGRSDRIEHDVYGRIVGCAFAAIGEVCNRTLHWLRDDTIRYTHRADDARPRASNRP